MNQNEYDFQSVKKILDVRFGKIELNFDRKTGIHYSCKEYFLQSENQEKKVTENLNKRILAPNLYYVPITDYRIENFNQFCSRITKLNIFMPIPDEDVKKEIKRRFDNKNPFTNMELTFLLYDVVFGLAHLEDIGVNHGKFGPEWIALTTTGYAVMEDPVYFELGYNGFYDLRKKKDFYLAPEIYEKAAFMQPLSEHHNYNKSDVFSAGLVLLEAGNLRRVKKIFRKGKIDNSTLKKLLERFKRRYPDNNLLYSTVKKMLELDPERRPSFKEIREKLPEYQIIKDHFLENEDSAPVEDDYGYSQDDFTRGGFDVTTSDIKSGYVNTFGGPMKADRLGFNDGTSRRPKTPQRGSMIPKKRSTTPNLAHDDRIMEEVKMHTPQRSPKKNENRYSHSPINRQYGFNITPNKGNLDMEYDRRHTMDTRTFMNNYNHQRPSQNDYNRRFSSGPNPQIGTKKPSLRRPSNIPDENPINNVIKNNKQEDFEFAPPKVKNLDEEDEVPNYTPERRSYTEIPIKEKDKSAIPEFRHTPIKLPVR